MSRMLKALQQIEARSEPPQPGCPVEDGKNPAEDGKNPAEDGENSVVDGESLVEAALAHVEAAVMMVDSQQPEIPAVEPAPVRWPDLHGEDRVRAYGKLADRVACELTPDGGATLLFASPDDADARCEVLIPLAATLVERTQGKVLLVDGDPSRGILSDRLGLLATRGLPDVLDGTITWQRAVRRTTVRGLSLIAGAAPGTSNCPRYEPPDVAHLLRELRSEYRIVLVDAALLHRAQLGRIGRHCDGAYMVVRLRQTTRRALRKAAGTLRACHTRLLGSVVVASEK
ncbi:MAG: hypothetical protein HQ567_07780 [Candidatus Nealsonbacteria bacterium]|nr:hypothetical protein [Candidatus Nealsonbacteria bacterium]